jgi:hypothetical protein
LSVAAETGFIGAAHAGGRLFLEGGLDWKALSLSPRDMDFMAAKDGAAREIALAFGVPPMLLGIPGDNTCSNYKEANRAFWRQTVLPLCGRPVEAIGGWLVPAFGEEAGSGGGQGLRLWYDADQVEALASEREALWARVGAAAFLSLNEKRAAVGYGPAEGGEGIGADGVKYNFDPDQPRVPRAATLTAGSGRGRAAARKRTRSYKAVARRTRYAAVMATTSSIATSSKITSQRPTMSWLPEYDESNSAGCSIRMAAIEMAHSIQPKQHEISSSGRWSTTSKSLRLWCAAKCQSRLSPGASAIEPAGRLIWKRLILMSAFGRPTWSESRSNTIQPQRKGIGS